jgi:hypothetical protein
MKKYFLLICLALPLFAFAGTPKGEQLTNMLWKDIQAKRVEKIAHYTSEKFQVVSAGGILTRTQYLDGIKKNKLPKIHLSGIQVTKGENVIVVTYLVCLSGDLGNGQIVLGGQQEQIIDVWKKVNHEWKLTAEGVVLSLQGDYVPEEN